MKNPVKEEEKKKSPFRVYRGGSWFYSTRITRVSDRISYYASSRDTYCGFRLVKNGKKK
tara:strand:+ start:877 stop:1053 length:177 start_codon:yes stop_codon:yes gene_type:complete